MISFYCLTCRRMFLMMAPSSRAIRALSVLNLDEYRALSSTKTNTIVTGGIQAVLSILSEGPRGNKREPVWRRGGSIHQ